MSDIGSCDFGGVLFVSTGRGIDVTSLMQRGETLHIAAEEFVSFLAANPELTDAISQALARRRDAA